MKQPCALQFRLADLTAAETRTLLDVPHDGIFHELAMRFEQRAQHEMKMPGAQHAKDLLGVTQIRRGLLDDASEVLKDAPLRIDDATHFGIERKTAKIRAPSDARARKIPGERSSENRARLLQGEGIARIGAGHYREQERRVLHTASHRAEHGKIEPGLEPRPARYAAGGGPETHHVAEARRIAQASPEIRSVGDG